MISGQENQRCTSEGQRGAQETGTWLSWEETGTTVKDKGSPLLLKALSSVASTNPKGATPASLSRISGQERKHWIWTGPRAGQGQGCHPPCPAVACWESCSVHGADPEDGCPRPAGHASAKKARGRERSALSPLLFALCLGVFLTGIMPPHGSSSYRWASGPRPHLVALALRLW